MSFVRLSFLRHHFCLSYTSVLTITTLIRQKRVDFYQNWLFLHLIKNERNWQIVFLRSRHHHRRRREVFPVIPLPAPSAPLLVHLKQNSEAESPRLHEDKLLWPADKCAELGEGVFTFLGPEYLSPHDSIAKTPRRQYLARSITLIHSLHIHISFGLGFNESHGNFTTTGVSEHTHWREREGGKS